jgi:stage II sporulation protein D
MPRLIRRHHKSLLTCFLVLFFLGGHPPEFGQEKAFFRGFVIQKPIIRVALAVNLETALVHASSGMKIYQVGESYKLLADDVPAVRIKGQREKLTEKFIVQVAQSRKKEDADDIAKDLKTKISNRIYVAQDSENELEGIYQVRVGDFLSRTDALEFMKTLAKLGIKDAWIIREEVAVAASQPRWILVNDELINLNRDAALYLIPANPESYLSYDGRNYRGIFVVRGSRKGTMLVNVLNVEDYLKGVVPGELSPTAFGELEALKAQAIAARTYALKNTGQFEDLGFDLYATPVSQVYRGMSIEHPLSSQAVEDTHGRVAVYGGTLINALYTSTCGGATEDAEKIFDGPSVPYLKSTVCAMEKDEEWQVRGSTPWPPVLVGGSDIGPKLATLAAMGILPGETSPSYFLDTARATETAEWIRKALAVVGKKNDAFGADPTPLTLASFARLVIDGFRWQERVRNLVGQAEAERATRNFVSLKPEDRSALAYFLVSELYPTAAEDGDRDRTLTRAEAASYLARVLSTMRDFYGQGYVKSLVKTRLTVVENGKTKDLEIAPNPFLFRSSGEGCSPTPMLVLSGGDVVKWIEVDGKVKLLQTTAAAVSNILDQSSPYHSWQVRVSREDLEERINQYYPIGKLVDLAVDKRGTSKRVTLLSVIGQEGQVRVAGLKIRQMLALRDNLFVIDRETNADGHINHFLFTGKGWGHGVGLCQVGAYRMAQKGAICEEILKKYYRGIKIERLY